MSTIQSSETFRPIRDFYGYRVSNWGRVQGRRIKGRGCGRVRDEWRDLKPIFCGSTGYHYVGLCSGPGKKTRMAIHRLVLEAFVGPCPQGCLCRHLDGNKTNNRLDNLAWGTPKENKADELIHGVRVRGEKQGHAILNEPIVRLILRLHRDGMPNVEIAEHLGIRNSNTVWQVTSRGNWKHVTI